MKDLRHLKAASDSTFIKKMLVSFVLLGFVVGVYLLSKFLLVGESIRLDESQSIWQTSHSLSYTLQIVAQDVHMPLYHIILHYWMQVFGTGIEAVRSLSLIFFILTIPLVYLLSRTVLTRPWALLITGLFSFAPFMNWYANEARMYTLLALFSVANQYFFVKILQKRKGWIGYALTAIVGAYSHYFFVFNLITQAIFYLFNRASFQPGALKRFVAVAVGLVLAVSPWIYYFISEGAANNTRPLIEAPTTVNFFNIYSQFLFGFQSDPINTTIVSTWPLLVIAVFFTVKRHLKIDVATSYLLVAASLPVLLAFALSFIITPFFLSRYMVPVVAPLFIVIGWLVSRYSKPAAVSIAVIWIAATGILFTQQTTSADNPVREDYKSVAAYVDENASPSDIVILSAPFTVYPFEYYYKGTSQVRTLPIWDRQNPGPVPPFEADKLPGEADRLIKGHEYVYLLLGQDQGYEQDIYSYFNNRYDRTFSKTYSNGLTLYVYRVGYAELPKLEK